MGVMIGSAVIPITLSLFWRRLTGSAMTAGATVGAALGLISWLIVSSLHPAGLADFFTSTGMSRTAQVSQSFQTRVENDVFTARCTRANRGIAIVRRLSVRNVDVPWAYKLVTSKV